MVFNFFSFYIAITIPSHDVRDGNERMETLVPEKSYLL